MYSQRRRKPPISPANQDAVALIEASDLESPYADVNPYLFEPPIAPHIAAREASVTIDLDQVLAAQARIAARSDCIVAEGAGGWLVPLDARLTMADLAAAMALPIVLVVGIRLGCLNHALLTVESIRSRGLVLAGWVANRMDPDSARFEDNVASLEYRIPAPCLATLDWSPEVNPQDIAASLTLDAPGVQVAPPHASP